MDVTSPNKANIYLCAVMNHDTIKCPAPNSNTRQHKTNTCIQKCDSFLSGITYTKILHSLKMLLWINDANQKRRITTVVTYQ